MKGCVIDCETDGLNPTLIHCLVYQQGGEDSVALTDYQTMRAFLLDAETLVGHNITRYDIPALERLLGISIGARLIDTLALSWYLEPKRFNHGLAEYGEDFGVPKPVIDDWEGLSIEEYVHRCREDVTINMKLWKKQQKQLMSLYGEEKEADRLIRYLSFKMDVAREKEEVRWKFDKDYCEKTLSELEPIVGHKIEALAAAMPDVKTWVDKKKPAKPFKQDGTLSATGTKWFALLEEKGLPEGHTAPIKVEGKSKPPNPVSHVQVKAWLSDLGWKPTTFNYKRDKETGDVRKIPVINLDGGGICESIKKLYDKEPTLSELDSLSVTKHRIGVLKGFLRDCSEDNHLKAEMAGFTNTLRLKHRVLVNLAGTDKYYGTEVRGCLTAGEGQVLCGSDMCSLEDNTKQHYMWEYDPDYVKEMSGADYDAHTALAVFAGAMSAAEEADFKKGEGNMKTMTALRKVYKAVNYSSVYGIGASTLARNLGIDKRRAEKLLEAYWNKNWSVLKIAEVQTTKTVGGQQWLYNPVSKFWYSLRAKKDIFSTLNQGTGNYCFDQWVKYIRRQGLKLTADFHDEVVICHTKGKEDKVEKALQGAIESANMHLKLNKPLAITVQFGENYAMIH